MTLIEPLDLKTLLVNILAGNMYIFIGIALIAIACLAAKFRMNNMIYGIMIALFAVMIGFWASWFLFIIVFVGGLMIYFVIGKLLKQ